MSENKMNEGVAQKLTEEEPNGEVSSAKNMEEDGKGKDEEEKAGLEKGKSLLLEDGDVLMGDESKFTEGQRNWDEENKDDIVLVPPSEMKEDEGGEKEEGVSSKMDVDSGVNDENVESLSGGMAGRGER